MWNRKELKEKAKNVIKNNYWTAVIVCFILMMFTGEFGSVTVGTRENGESLDPNYVENRVSTFFNKEERENLIRQRYQLNNIPEQAINAIRANLNNIIKSEKYIFKIWDAIKLFYLEKPQIGIALCVGAIIACAFIIFISEPLTVGGKKYFLKARENKETRISTILDVYKNKNWFHIAGIMFLKNLYNLLWFLTIIGGFIKTYEYRMIPYILAQNPKVSKKEAFDLSKQMMKGNKWKAFVLDMSFFLWNLLSVLTFGLLGILYVNPYNLATNTELYIVLKEKAIKEKYQYCEILENNQ